jgi:hypothetical protein
VLELNFLVKSSILQWWEPAPHRPPPIPPTKEPTFYVLKANAKTSYIMKYGYGASPNGTFKACFGRRTTKHCTSLGQSNGFGLEFEHPILYLTMGV